MSMPDALDIFSSHPVSTVFWLVVVMFLLYLARTPAHHRPRR